MKGEKAVVYVGTYSVRGSAGIYRALFDPGSGALELAGETPSDDPSFLAFGARGRVLYAVNEQKEGRVSAYAVEGIGSAFDPGVAGNGPAGFFQLAASADILLVDNIVVAVVYAAPIGSFLQCFQQRLPISRVV